VLIACWSPKGGSGTTVVACALALVLADSESRAGVLLADLAGDVPAALGMPQPDGPGLGDWLAAADAPTDALERLAVDAGPGLRVLPRGADTNDDERGDVLAAALAAVGHPVIVDCGRAERGAALAIAAAADASLLVVRPCYLALRRALAAPVRPSAVVVVAEDGRALARADIEDVLGVPVSAVVEHDPAVARAVDAGLLASTLPRQLGRALRDAA